MNDVCPNSVCQFITEEMSIVCPCGDTVVDINKIFWSSVYTTDGLSNIGTELWLVTAFIGDTNDHSTKDLLLTMYLERALTAKEVYVHFRI